VVPDPDPADPADPDPPDPADPGPADPADPDPADPDPADPELFLRRVLGDVAVERELAPAVRVRVVGLVPDVPEAGVDLEVRVEDLRLVEAAEAALGVAGFDAVALLARSSSCSRARTRCWRRATSSRVAMPRRPSWRFTSRWTMRVMVSRFFWVRRIRSSATRPTWADWTSPCLASSPATRSAWARVRSLRLANACRYCSLPLATSPPPAHVRRLDSGSGPRAGQRTRVGRQPVW
jgi:hypothetical protein